MPLRWVGPIHPMRVGHWYWQAISSWQNSIILNKQPHYHALACEEGLSIAPVSWITWSIFKLKKWHTPLWNTLSQTNVRSHMCQVAEKAPHHSYYNIERNFLGSN